MPFYSIIERNILFHCQKGHIERVISFHSILSLRGPYREGHFIPCYFITKRVMLRCLFHYKEGHAESVISLHYHKDHFILCHFIPLARGYFISLLKGSFHYWEGHFILSRLGHYTIQISLIIALHEKWYGLALDHLYPLTMKR